MRATNSLKAWTWIIAAALASLLLPVRAVGASQGDSAAVVAADAAALDSAILADSVALITELLVANGATQARATPAAAAIMKYTRLRGLDPLLVVGIIGVENATLAPRSRSHVGASGVMQVMPFWKRYIRDCGDDLRNTDVNICFGTRILRIALDETKTVREALLRYNGCVRTPGCQAYASAVFSRAGRAVLMSRTAARTAARTAPSGVVAVAGPAKGAAAPASGI